MSKPLGKGEPKNLHSLNQSEVETQKRNEVIRGSQIWQTDCIGGPTSSPVLDFGLSHGSCFGHRGISKYDVSRGMTIIHGGLLSGLLVYLCHQHAQTRLQEDDT